MNVAGWTTAADSAFNAAVHWPEHEGGQCLYDLGCPPTTAIVPCPRIPEAQSVAQALRDPIPSGGRDVVIRAPLVPHTVQTVVDCGQPQRCCNDRGGWLGLGKAEPWIRLLDRAHPQAFDCGGDESIGCCGFRVPEGEVVAVGRLRTEQAQPVLDHVSLCDATPSTLLR